jgi:hypothetical protein
MSLPGFETVESLPYLFKNERLATAALDGHLRHGHHIPIFDVTTEKFLSENVP